MGNLMEEPEKHHVLLLGVQQVGKTRFLYEGQLQGKFKEEIKPTEGYNVETMRYEKITFALWDLSASPEMIQLWPVFYKFIPFEAVVFMVRVFPKAGAKKKLNNEVWSQSRKVLHSLMSEETFQNKPLLLVVNVGADAIVAQNDAAKERGDLMLEVQEVLMWDKVKNPHKDIVAIDASNFMEQDIVVTALHHLHQAAFPPE